MSDEVIDVIEDSADDVAEVSMRVYEAGYQISSSVKEEDIEGVVAGIRALVEKAGGHLIAEGAPMMQRLAFNIESKEHGKRVQNDRAYFGWLKFESTIIAAEDLKKSLLVHPQIIRSMVFGTVREETRAKIKAPTLREVKRTDTIKSSPRREEVAAAPMSEADLEKAISDITV